MIYEFLSHTGLTNRSAGICVAAAVATFLMVGGLQAAERDTKPGQPNAALPEVTTASYGDWVMRCVRPEGEPKAPRTCEVAQTLTVQGQTSPVAQIAIGRLKPTDPLRLTVVLPNNVALDLQPTVAEETGGPGTSLAWRRCAQWGCAADLELKPDALNRLRGPKERVVLEFKDATNRPVSLPFSLRGLAQSLDALPAS